MFLPSTITLKFGNSGDFVTELQNRLVLVKCLSDGMVTGFYDGSTVNAVMMFQGREGLHADGIAGPDTLRRLNGVISGSSGSAPTSTQEEEQKIEATQPVQQFVWGEQPTVNPFFEAPAVATPEAPRIAPIEAAPAQADMRPMQAPPPLQPALPSDTLQSFAQAPTPLQTAPAMSPRELAAQQQNAPVALGALAMPATAQQPIPATGQPLSSDPSQTPLNATAIPVTQRPTTVPATQPTALDQPAAAPQGIVAKTMQFANAMMQKLSDYFEKKLPPTVLDEVHSIGKEMHRSGMKEAPIPTGPDQRAPELPTRTQEPVKAPQRG